MNLDELVLRNVISMEEAELVHNIPSSSSPDAATASLFIGKQPPAEEMDWVQYQREMLMDSKFPVSETIFTQKNVADIGVGLFQNNLQAMSENSDFPAADSGKKRRQFDDVKEKTIERRQKRMIKNRESAARSRARKQAYTNQLEHEVFCLRKTNSWLRKQEEVEKLFLSNPVPLPRYQLRRTSSALF